MRQLALIPKQKYAKRKVVRPISTRHFNHVVLKARKPVLRKHHRTIKALISKWQTRYSIRLKALAIMEDHIHFALKTPNRESLQDFMRALTGQIALKTTKGKLWKQRAWSRILKSPVENFSITNEGMLRWQTAPE